VRRTDGICGAVAGDLGKVDVCFADRALVLFVRREVFVDYGLFEIG